MTDLDRLIREHMDTMDGPLMANALRAILDLHQPYWGLEHANATCPVCADDHPDTASMSWPCLTVAAIARELGVTPE